MKIIIASDVHGSKHYMNLLINEVNKKGASLILLGDIYYHGPRNPLPKEYDPMGVSEILNTNLNKITVLKGNCDASVDTLISKFDFIENLMLIVNGKKIFMQHGDIYSKFNLPKTDFDVLIYGHYHTGFIEETDGKVIINPGSISLPKDGTAHSYLELDDSLNTLTLINLESGEEIKSIQM